MSNVVFNLPNCAGWSIIKRPRFTTLVADTVSHRGQFRIAKQIYPIWEYEFTFDYLHGIEQSGISDMTSSGVDISEFESVMGLYLQMKGGFDNFLYSDENDNTVSMMPFGVGDGSTNSFQLTRNIGGGVDIVQNVDTSGAPDAFGMKPSIFKGNWEGIKNLLFSTSSVGDGNWIVSYNNNGSGTAQALPQITQKAGFAPDGTLTATKIVYAIAPPSGDAHQVYQFSTSNFSAPIGGRTFTWSIWLRTLSGANTVEFQISDNVSEGGGITVTLSPQWKRYSFTFTFSGANVRTSCFGYLGTKNPVSSAGTIYAWGAQLEESATATTYVPVAGVMQGPVQQFSFARTNKVPWSQAFSGHWSLPVPTGSSLTDNATTAPDGTNTGCAFAYPGNTDTYAILLCGAGAINTNYTASFWARVASGTLVIGFGITDASGAGFANGLSTLTTKWQKFTLTAKSPGTNMATMQMFIGGNGHLNGISAGTLYMWGAQLEAATFASPYIPTLAGAPVTVTDFSLGSTGIVTLAVTPVVGAVLSWTGSFFYRLRFADDNIDFEEFMSQLWTLKKLKCESVIL